MNAIFALALKDLKLLLRNRATLFFTFVWPLLMAIGFGFMFSSGGEKAKLLVLAEDADKTDMSAEFLRQLTALDSVDLKIEARELAEQKVKRGQAIALIVIPKGFGLASQRLFYGDPPRIQVLIDPSRKAESGMLEGLLMQVAAQNMSTRMTDSTQSQQWLQTARKDVQALPKDEREKYSNLLAAVEQIQPQNEIANSDRPNAQAVAWSPLSIDLTALQVKRSGPENAFAISFPQGMLWALVGCLMSFATGFATEREKGTWLRLRTSPQTAGRLMLGKALAALIALVAVQAFLLLFARLVFDLTPAQPLALFMVISASAIAFTGMMLLISSVGRTVQGVSSAGWASLMPLMMIGGGMIPLMVMPRWMGNISAFSPVNWSLRSIEGAIWRDYSWPDYLLPVLGLVFLGVLAFAIGAHRLARRVD